MYFDPKMTLEEYEDFKLHDEMNIGYDVEEDDLPDEIEEDSMDRWTSNKWIPCG